MSPQPGTWGSDTKLLQPRTGLVFPGLGLLLPTEKRVSRLLRAGPARSASSRVEWGEGGVRKPRLRGASDGPVASASMC